MINGGFGEFVTRWFIFFTLGCMQFDKQVVLRLLKRITNPKNTKGGIGNKSHPRATPIF